MVIFDYSVSIFDTIFCHNSYRRLKKSAITKKSAINSCKKQAVLDFMKGKDFVKASDVAEAINLKPSRTRDYLGELVKDGFIIAEGSNRNRKYRLKK